MKKLIALILVLFMVMSLTACGSSDSRNETTEDTIALEHEKNISAALSQKIPTLIVSVTRSATRFDLSVSLQTEAKVSDFGIYVLEVQAAYEAEFDEDLRGNFSVNLPIDGKNPSMIRFSSDDYTEMSDTLSGTLSDSRSGEVVSHDISSIDDLCEFFPATTIEIAKSEISDEDLAIYEEVMDILNEQMDRSEDEIFEEIAPNYGMTPEELKQFMRDVMEEIY